MAQTNDWFTDLISDFFGTSTKSRERLSVAGGPGPDYWTERNGTEMTLSVELPGVDPKTLEVSVGGSKIQVVGKNGDKTLTNKYTISPEFNVQTAKASWRHGLLEIRIARGQEPELRRVFLEIK